MLGSVAARLRPPVIEEGEIRRRVVHASGSGLPLLYVLGEPYGVSWELLQAAAVLVLAITLVLEFLRLRIGLDWRIYDELTREYEQDSVAGYALYAVGMAAVALAFPPEIAIPAMFMLAIGDPVGGILGSAGPGTAKRGPVLVVVFLVCFGLALPFVDPLVAAVGGLVAAIADGVTPVIGDYVIDDNLTIPIGAGVVMYLATVFVPL